MTRTAPRETRQGDRIVRIGGASGAWGDSPLAVGQLIGAGVDYLMMDYLAEVTMSLLAKARAKDPAAGFPPDFVAYLKPHLAELKQRGIRVASNAGGVNPLACKRALEAVASAAGVALEIAVVIGDDLMPMAEELRHDGVREWRSGEPLPPALLTANAYLGALPIAAAFARGADVVVTGRGADSALALGILMHEFGWRDDDFDLLAAGSLVGHLLECGPQATGGLFTDWEDVPDWANIGYPIAECRADGTFDITKPDGTGGLVTPATVGEQVLYEIGDPAAYLLPDVTADFAQVRIVAAGPDRVRVTGARGRPPTAHYKVSATYQRGWRATALVAIVGVDAAKKAERTAEALLERARRQLAARGSADFSAVHVEALGAEASYGAGSRARDAREVVLRLVVEHDDAAALERFAREIGSSGLSFAPGTASLLGGRPKAAPVIRLFTFFVAKERLAAQTVRIGDGEPFEVATPTGIDPVGATTTARPPSRSDPAVPPLRTNASATPSSRSDPEAPATPSNAPATPLSRSDPGTVAPHSSQSDPAEPAAQPRAGANAPCVDVALDVVAHARSGDKGDTSNVAVFCRRPEYFEHLRDVLTVERMRAHFAGLVLGPVTRFEAPGLCAFNFTLDDALGGGGMASLRIDPLGKSYGQRALEMTVPVPSVWLDRPD